MVSTYRQIAVALGKPRACRAVGNALNKNPFPVKIPCHRVVRSDGKIGGFARGTAKKASLLKNEGIRIKNNKVVNFSRYFISAGKLKARQRS